MALFPTIYKDIYGNVAVADDVFLIVVAAVTVATVYLAAEHTTNKK